VRRAQQEHAEVLEHGCEADERHGVHVVARAPGLAGVAPAAGGGRDELASLQRRVQLGRQSGGGGGGAWPG